MVAQECGIRLAERRRRGIKERDRHLIHLDQMKHLPQQRRVHSESRLVQSIRHDGEDILNQRQEELLVEPLCYVRCSSHVQQQLMQNVEALKRLKKGNKTLT